MAEDDHLTNLVRSTLRSAGRQLAEARQAYDDAKRSAQEDLPVDEQGQARIVCRRHAERRAVRLDEEGRPHCLDADHPDCQGCIEDIADGTVETW
ncbi:hypothetical protein Hrd1104_11365 [Halorhabdus sp. CBA1104]|uniref:DUF7091 family protein n=1 Tax=Halorhabdus sp. CBA1104 TaxID=1380432 RepID=UPI0012B20D2E|nr:hypothetical protein [Halorhabdus sp. CBA1104]QGN07840.1 hypothetical protein Hrd1104_11365 [Halorhabdus sp. CBA1104]